MDSFAKLNRLCQLNGYSVRYKHVNTDQGKLKVTLILETLRPKRFETSFHTYAQNVKLAKPSLVQSAIQYIEEKTQSPSLSSYEARDQQPLDSQSLLLVDGRLCVPERPLRPNVYATVFFGKHVPPEAEAFIAAQSNMDTYVANSDADNASLMLLAMCLARVTQRHPNHLIYVVVGNADARVLTDCCRKLGHNHCMFLSHIPPAVFAQ